MKLTSERRYIRVFISSTFRDMQVERDMLIKRTFPELRKRCRERGIEFTEVDLRWGVTEEQAERGEVLPICLKEIENSHPFFICLLGERYGWVPSPGTIPASLLESQPWLADHSDKSVTEMEIIHGVLANPEMNNRAFFYFRNPGYLDSLTINDQGDFRDSDPDRIKQLTKLKEKIRASGCRVRENYSDPGEVAGLILDDLWEIIDEEYPAGTRPGPLDQEIIDHEQYAESRRGVYIGREEYFRRLDSYATNNEPPLVVTGASGSGKSALIANWVYRFRRENPGIFVIQHYIGSSQQGSNHISIIKRIMQEVRRRFLLPEKLPDDTEELKKAFPKWLGMAARRGNMILVLDGLNQLEDEGNAHELWWLPVTFPEEVKVIVSVLPGKILDLLKERNWSIFNVTPLQKDERHLLITDYLSRFRKALSSKQLSIIVLSEQTGNPLFLKVFLDELRVFGVHEKLDEAISHYLDSGSPGELFDKILQRLEKDYETNRPGLVGEALSLIFSSRRGLSEKELLEMLGFEGAPLPQALWSPLFLAIEESLVSRQGLLNFFHDYFRQAVYNRYIVNEEDEQHWHERLGSYFSDTPADYRKADELPWQLMKAGDWSGLAKAMQDPALLTEAWDINKYDLRQYWVLMEKHTGLTVVDAFREIINSVDELLPGTWVAGRLLISFGYKEEAFKVLNHMSECLDEDTEMFRIVQNDKATILRDWGRLDEAMTMYRKNEEEARQRGDEDDIRISLNNQALLLGMQGRLDEAYDLFSELESVARENSNFFSLVIYLSNQSRILAQRGRKEEALDKNSEAERLARSNGNRDDVNLLMLNRASILKDMGRTDESITILEQVEQAYRSEGDREGLGISLTGHAQILSQNDNIREALDMYKESERLLRVVGNKQYLTINLAGQAKIIEELGGTAKALRMYREAEAVLRELGDKENLAICLKDQVPILFCDNGEKDKALELIRESEQLLRDIDNPSSLRSVLSAHILLLKDLNSNDELPGLYEELEKICRWLGENDELLEYLEEHSHVLNSLERHEEALALLVEQEHLMIRTGKSENLAMNLGNQGLTLSSAGRFEEAMEKHIMAGQLFTEQGNMTGQSISLCNRALIQREWGRHQEALKLHEEEEKLCRKARYAEGLQRSLGYQALALFELRQYRKALKKLREQKKIADREGIEIQEIFNETRNRLENGQEENDSKE
jgi:nephrocystin-3